MIHPVSSRRHFIQSIGAGLGSVGAVGHAGRAERGGRGAAAPSAHRQGPHFAPQAKHNIVLFMPGGPSQMDLFDPKPALQKYAGQRPDSVNLRTERTTGGLLPFALRVQKARPGRHRSQRTAAEARRDHRRPLRRPLDVHVQPDAHAGAQPVSLRQHRRDAPVDGLVDLLWARHRKPEPARLRRARPRRRRRAGGAQRLPAVAASGHRVRRLGRPSPRR